MVEGGIKNSRYGRVEECLKDRCGVGEIEVRKG